ncbi:MAG TPA: MFS transporter [Baekduia sp.]|uniref:MFS transporter n=1 Tax=Baekduia sp. TaxID=2600305 RepID=UPI002D7A2A7F|nr:MFS transporter [Baekduia sp.]HET6506768.1 MFS transporter [Baekduia sp.]
MPGRMPVAVLFAVHGAANGSFATRIPWIRDRLDLDPGLLGLALLAPAAGALLAMPPAGALVHRRDGRRVTGALIGAFAIALTLPALAPSYALLWLALLIFGAVAGGADVAMNTQAVAVEERAGRSIMSGMHGAWSVGGMAGSLLGVLAAHAGLDARIHLGAMAVVLLVVSRAAARRLPDAAATGAGAGGAAARAHADPPRLARPSRPVLIIGVVGFGAVFAEGASADWSAVYLRDVVGASPATAAAAYTGFAAAMALARLVGDRVIARVGPVATVRAGGALAALGALLVVVARTPLAAVPGFALIGLGIATVVPLAFAAAGRAVPHAGQGIAAVATIAYGAGLAAPGIIGAIASAASLPAAFAIVATLCVGFGLGAGALRPAAHGR